MECNHMYFFIAGFGTNSFSIIYLFSSCFRTSFFSEKFSQNVIKMSHLLDSVFIAEKPFEEADRFLASPMLHQASLDELEGWSGGARRPRGKPFTAVFAQIVKVKRFDQNKVKDPVKKYTFQAVKSGTMGKNFTSAVDSRMLLCRYQLKSLFVIYSLSLLLYIFGLSVLKTDLMSSFVI
jgi:hypothetical protein